MTNPMSRNVPAVDACANAICRTIDDEPREVVFAALVDTLAATIALMWPAEAHENVLSTVSEYLPRLVATYADGEQS